MNNATATSGPPRVQLKAIESRETLRNFCCGVSEIDRWAKQKAHKLHERGRARVKIATAADGVAPLGFYSLTHSIAEAKKLLRNEDRDVWDNAPILYIGYIAVDRSRQRSGIGSVMLIDALRSAHSVHKIAPLYGVGLRALNQDAQRLYEKMGFQKAPNESGETPLMILPIWTIADLFES